MCPRSSPPCASAGLGSRRASTRARWDASPPARTRAGTCCSCGNRRSPRSRPRSARRSARSWRRRSEAMPRLPPAGLAVAGWRTPAGVALDLRYTPEETDWLDPRPAAVWEDTLAGSPALGAEDAGHYAVDDPYGGERGAVPIGRCFGREVVPEQVTFAAGITSLLHALADL